MLEVFLEEALDLVNRKNEQYGNIESNPTHQWISKQYRDFRTSSAIKYILSYKNTQEKKELTKAAAYLLLEWKENFGSIASSVLFPGLDYLEALKKCLFDLNREIEEEKDVFTWISEKFPDGLLMLAVYHIVMFSRLRDMKEILRAFFYLSLEFNKERREGNGS